MLRLTRSLHTLPRLTKPSLYSTPQFTIVTQHHQHLLSRLNQLTAGTADETRHPLAAALMAQGDAKRQRVYSTASDVWSGHFFLQQFKPIAGQAAPSRALEARINNDFGSLEGLKEEILNKADSLVGQGWVFVVEDVSKKLNVVAINNSGLPFAHARLDMDLNGAISEQDYAELKRREEEKGVQGRASDDIPLLAFNLWDVAFLEDFGVNGKKEFVEKCWKELDWEVINGRVFSL